MAEAAVESPQPETSGRAGLALMPGSPNNDCSSSPPPNCAICLGNCINKCFSDSCMHQFCFNCLLEWSKVKAVCPLCKQPFKSIIHNVKSNDEYDQHYIRQPASTESRFEDLVWRDNSRHFQFRTTLTVDPHGELAIQHLLSTRSHTLPQYTRMNVVRTISDYIHSNRRDISSSNYRRSIYERNLYTFPMTDVTGRYRDTSPSFFREYPGSKNRLVPFLQREINALIPDERSLRAMNLVHRILAAIEDHPIRGRYMKNMLRPELGRNTEHFLYEFYTYARSPFDLYGYDRNAELLTTEPNITEDSSDSDVLIVSVDRAPLIQTEEIIEINSESSHDSDVVIREPTPPVTVDLVGNTSSDDTIPLNTDARSEGLCISGVNAALAASRDQPVQMPLKVRHKSRRYQRKRRRLEIVSSSSDSESSNSDDERRQRSRKRPIILKIRKVQSSQSEECSSSDEATHRAKRKKLRKKKHHRKHEIDHQVFAHSQSCSQSQSLSQTSLISTSASTSTSTDVNVDPNSSIKHEDAFENNADQSVQASNVVQYHAMHPDVSLNELYQRNMNAWFPDYSNSNMYAAYNPMDYSTMDKIPAYFHTDKFKNEPGPSGMNSNGLTWQPKPCSDSD